MSDDATGRQVALALEVGGEHAVSAGAGWPHSPAAASIASTPTRTASRPGPIPALPRHTSGPVPRYQIGLEVTTRLFPPPISAFCNVLAGTTWPQVPVAVSLMITSVIFPLSS